MHSKTFPVAVLCSVYQVKPRTYYAWLSRPKNVFSFKIFRLHQLIKKLFGKSRGSLGARQMSVKLRKEGYKIGRHKTRKLMRELNLVVKQRRAYKITTQRKHNDAVADNLLAQQFNPTQKNVAWAGDVTYLRTAQGWMYLAVVMDLHSRRIIGWAVSQRMTVDLVADAIKMTINLRGQHPGLIFHSDRGSQYTSKVFQKLCKRLGNDT